jgi:hypothetical protein
MERSESYFKKYILPVVVASLLSWGLAKYFSKDEAKLVSREKTETRQADGSATKREMEIYK